MPVTTYPFVQQQIIRYGMTTYLVLGLFGNICNCIMFTRRQYRRTPSSIYFFYFSLFAIAYLLWVAIPSIDTLNHTDLQTQSVFYCKVRLYGRHVLGQCLRYLITFACLDRFFATQLNARIRLFSSFFTAKLLIVIVCPLWLCIACYMPIITELNNGVCAMNDSYKLMYAIYQLIFASILPPLLMSIFSILTIRSLRERHLTQLQAKRRDRDLICMVFAQVIMTICACIPYSMYLMYEAVTYYIVDKSKQRIELEAFLGFVAQFIIYLISVTSFYIFILTSKRFRTEFIDMITKYWYKYVIRRAFVTPIN